MTMQVLHRGVRRVRRRAHVMEGHRKVFRTCKTSKRPSLRQSSVVLCHVVPSNNPSFWGDESRTLRYVIQPWGGSGFGGVVGSVSGQSRPGGLEDRS